MRELSAKLGLLERMRHVCDSVDIAIPGIVVVGEQSAGKSSLLENISGIQFPRAQNTCTRMPCVLTMVVENAPEPYALVSMRSAIDLCCCTCSKFVLTNQSPSKHIFFVTDILNLTFEFTDQLSARFS